MKQAEQANNNPTYTPKSTRIGILIMVFSSLFACVGQLLWKIGADKGFLYIFFGFVLYGLGALLMIIAYRFGRLSTLQPVLSLNYVLSAVLAVLVLHEHMGLLKIGAILLILLGVILIAGSKE